MTLEKLAWKKQSCWMFVCKKCKQEVDLGGEYTPHFKTKTEALEYLDDDGGEDYVKLSCGCVEGEINE